MKILRLKSKVLTPLHFETGIAITPLDFIVRDEKMYRIDFRRLSRLHHEVYLNICEEIENDRFREAHQLLTDNFNTDFAQYSADAGPDFMQKYKKSKFSPDEKFHIGTTIRSDAPKFSPIIPGSSVKGTIRTAFLSCELEKMADDKKNDIVNFRGAPPGGTSKYLWQEGMILDSMYKLPGRKNCKIFDRFNDPFEDFAVEDIVLDKSTTEIASITNTSQKRSGELNFGDSITIEAIPSQLSKITHNVEFEMIIRIDENSPILSWAELKAILDEYFLIELRREINQLSMTSRFFWKDIAERLDYYQNSIKENTSMIRIGRFCGRNFTTIRALQKGTPHSRNLYDSGTPMGWVFLEYSEEQD